MKIIHEQTSSASLIVVVPAANVNKASTRAYGNFMRKFSSAAQTLRKEICEIRRGKGWKRKRIAAKQKRSRGTIQGSDLGKSSG
ncbi:MAG: hypothetical protein PHO46_02665 [Thermoguttaceae bacterium]|nr:hypothetical protein [Thermoguttaceae bacterium]